MSHERMDLLPLSEQIDAIEIDAYDNQQSFIASKGILEVMTDDGLRLLVYTRDGNTSDFSGYVDLFGGGRENDGDRLESPYEVLLREVSEEIMTPEGVGLDVHSGRLLYAVKFCVDDLPGLGKDIGVPPDSWGTFLVMRLDMTADDVAQLRLGPEGRDLDLVTVAEFINHPKAVPAFQELARQYYGR